MPKEPKVKTIFHRTRPILTTLPRYWPGYIYTNVARNNNSRPTTGFSLFARMFPVVVRENVAKDKTIPTILFGYILGFTYFVIWNIFRQYRRSNRMSIYIWMCLGEIVSSLASAILSWFRLMRGIPLSLWLLLLISIIWTFQTVLLFLIIINRLNLVLSFTNPKRYRQIRNSTLIICGVVILITICIWIPAFLHASPEFLYEVWMRLLKVFLGLLDAALNIYFIRTVNRELVDYGLIQYTPLATFNFRIMVLSLALDIVVLALTWLSNQFTYAMCREFVYLAKLNIELSMGHFIAKIVRHSREPTECLSQTK